MSKRHKHVLRLIKGRRFMAKFLCGTQGKTLMSEQLRLGMLTLAMQGKS